MGPVSSKRNKVVLYSSEIPMLINDHHTQQKLLPLQSQVAGHSAMNGKSSLGMLLHPEGYVLKPLGKMAQGENEIKFYQHLNSATDPHTLELREYVPKYYGTRKVLLNGKDIPCIVLQNVTQGMNEPCVIDIKMGQQTWEPNAPEEKKNIEQAKYVESRQECGFCIPGMQYYDIVNHELVKYGKEYGKTLDKKGVENALKLFLNWNSSISRPLILQFLCNLWKILKWFQSQRQFLFYSSSLLFVYDAHLWQCFSSSVPVCAGTAGCSSSSQKNLVHKVEEFHEKIKNLHLSGSSFEQELNVLKTECFHEVGNLKKGIWPNVTFLPNKMVDVKMIDFAHTLIFPRCEIDSNYMDGLENLIAILETLLRETY